MGLLAIPGCLSQNSILDLRNLSDLKKIVKKFANSSSLKYTKCYRNMGPNIAQVFTPPFGLHLHQPRLTTTSFTSSMTAPLQTTSACVIAQVVQLVLSPQCTSYQSTNTHCLGDSFYALLAQEGHTFLKLFTCTSSRDLVVCYFSLVSISL